MQPGRTEHIGGEDAEVHYEQPEKCPVVPSALVLQPERHRIEREGDDIGVRLRAVAEENHKTRQGSQGTHSELEVAPAFVAPEEGDGHQTHHRDLH